MKRIPVTLAVLLLASTAWAAKQDITTIAAPATLGAFRTAVNGEFAKAESNFVELYNGKADASCFASESAFNACFELTWATGGSVSDVAYGSGWNGDTGAASKNAIYDKIETIAGGTMTYPTAGVAVSTGSAWGTSLDSTSTVTFGNITAASGTLAAGVANTTQGTLVLYTNTNPVYAFGLSPAASPSASVSLKAPPGMPTADNSLLNFDINGTGGWTDPATFLTPSGVGGALTVTATGFDGNLATTDNTLQEIAQKVDDLNLSSTFDPAAPGAIGGTTPAAAAFTTVTGTSFTANRTTSPQALELYEGTGGGSNKVTIAPSSTLGADVSIVAERITQTISGTVELNTTTVANSGVIASGASQLLGTHATATGAATTDSCEWGFVGDPVAKTGFVPSANGMLSVWCYVDATGYVQVRISNNTASSVTLNTAGNGATIKWMVRQ